MTLYCPFNNLLCLKHLSSGILYGQLKEQITQAFYSRMYHQCVFNSVTVGFYS